MTEYDVEPTSTELQQLDSTFRNITDNTDNNAHSWMNKFNGSTSGVSITLGFFRTSYEVLRSMMDYMSETMGITSIVSEALGLPPYVATLVMSMIIITFIVALILILIGTGII